MVRFPRYFLAAIVLLVAACPPAAGQNLVHAELEKCRQHAENLERLSCYDKIVLPATAVPVEPTTTASNAAKDTAAATNSAASATTDTAAATNSATTIDDIGFPDDDEPTTLPISIARCGEGSNYIYYFHFENGQVWRYLGRKKLRYRDCAVSAELVEDRFGFAIRMPGEQRLLRVKRSR